MTKILAFDSMYIVSPIRNLYIGLISKILNRKKSDDKSLILYRLDKDNMFLRDKRNISGSGIGVHNDHIDALAIKFYKKIEKSGTFETPSIKGLHLYKLYTRQVKLKLIGVLKCAHIIRRLSIDSEDNLEIIADRQTISIMKEALFFLEYHPTDIKWKSHSLLTVCITINSLIMRFAALIRMYASPSDLPDEYFYRHIDSDLPTVLINMPKRRPEDFFLTYVQELGNEFNIILYSLGFLQETPNNYRRIRIKKVTGFLRGSFSLKNLCCNADSYIADILLIFKKHANLNRSIDVVHSIYSKKIDVHISRLQTNVVDNYLAIEARRRGVFILGDVMEEIFYCDSAICSSEHEYTESLRLALSCRDKIKYRGGSSLIRYRLKNFDKKQDHYLHKLLNIDFHKKIIFYASDPSKEESQRYLTEKFIINYFSQINDLVLVIKTHPQDNGKISNYAYQDGNQPVNVVLIGDFAQKGKIISKHFRIFDEFDFNTALSSCDGFLTASSSSILQALVIGIKTGIIDKFNNGFYDYLIKNKASTLIYDNKTMKSFLDAENTGVPDEILKTCGLMDDNHEFNLGNHLKESLSELKKS